MCSWGQNKLKMNRIGNFFLWIQTKLLAIFCGIARDFYSRALGKCAQSDIQLYFVKGIDKLTTRGTAWHNG